MAYRVDASTARPIIVLRPDEFAALTAAQQKTALALLRANVP